MWPLDALSDGIKNLLHALPIDLGYGLATSTNFWFDKLS